MSDWRNRIADLSESNLRAECPLLMEAAHG